MKDISLSHLRQVIKCIKPSAALSNLKMFKKVGKAYLLLTQILSFLRFFPKALSGFEKFSPLFMGFWVLFFFFF